MNLTLSVHCGVNTTPLKKLVWKISWLKKNFDQIFFFILSKLLFFNTSYAVQGQYDPIKNISLVNFFV